MDNFKKLRPILYLMGVIFFFQCAQRVGITGGDKDNIPPQLVRSNPDTFSTNFASTKIRLDFDEFIQLNNVRKNLLVTPVLRYDPTILASGKKVIIKNLDDSLWENTTYVMEFNEAIEDITEKNPAKGFRYVFSTGDYVDSLEIMGEIKEAYTLKPAEDIYVFLYSDLSDSIPYKEKPRYVGRTNGDGFFHIQNMKEGRYKVFINSDENGNYLFDKKGERIDFLDDAISISPDTGQFINGHIFREANNNQFMKGFGILNRWALYMSFAKKVDTLDIRFDQKSFFPENAYSRQYNQERDSVVIWIKDSTLAFDTINFFAKADTFPEDTLRIIYYEEVKAKKFTFRNNLMGEKLNLMQDYEMNFDYPLANVDKSRIFVVSDSIRIPFKVKLNGSQRKLSIVGDWKSDSTYKVILDSAAVTDIYGRSNDSIVRSFKCLEKSYYGTMEISLNGLDAERGMLYLLDPQGAIKEQVYLENKNSHFFEYLHPGEYVLKYFIDENGNQNWDPGNYMEKRHAEKVFIYQGTITIRSNWDQVIEWKFN